MRRTLIHAIALIAAWIPIFFLWTMLAIVYGRMTPAAHEGDTDQAATALALQRAAQRRRIGSARSRARGERYREARRDVALLADGNARRHGAVCRGVGAHADVSRIRATAVWRTVER